MEGYGCSHGLLVPTDTGETERESGRLWNSPIALPGGCGIGVKRGDLGTAEAGWTHGELRFPGVSSGPSRSRCWGGVGRPPAASSSSQPLSLSPALPRICVLTGEDGGGHTSASMEKSPAPQPQHRMHGQAALGGLGCGIRGCRQPCPMSPCHGDARGGVGGCRTPKALRDAQSQGEESPWGCECHRSSLAAGDAHAD